MTSVTLVDKSVERLYRGFVIERFRSCLFRPEKIRQTIRDIAWTVINSSTGAHIDAVSAVRGMVEGVRLCAKNSNLNVQTAVCEAATAAYDASIEQNKGLARNIKHMVEGSYSDFHIVIYKRYKEGRETAPLE